jgi:inositol transport system ATP-binding protein
MTGVSKQFPGVKALEGVHLEIAEGEVHALLGENGAGKSTLLKILSGAQSADEGAIELLGEAIRFETPHDAQRAGIVTIYQEFTLAPDMSIAENVFIGREPGSRMFVSWRKLASETRAIIKRIGLNRDPMTLVRDLSVAEQQIVEIARALSMRSRLIVMDEPTSALSEAEVANLAAHHRPAARGRHFDHFRHPSARRSVSPLRSLHGAARRPLRRRWDCRRNQCRGDHPHDGRARRRRALWKPRDP